MFLCDCHHCGRRELRGPRSLTTSPDGRFVAACRGCGATVAVAGARPGTPATNPPPAPARVAVPTAA